MAAIIDIILSLAMLGSTSKLYLVSPKITRVDNGYSTMFSVAKLYNDQ
jgi:hypothetical protein